MAKNLQNKVNFIQFVFLRWIRFAPPLLGVIAVWKCITLLGSGPFFSNSILESSIQKSCHDSQWWKTFLFINNWSNLADTVSAQRLLLQSNDNNYYLSSVHTSQLVPIGGHANSYNLIWPHYIASKSFQSNVAYFLHFVNCPVNVIAAHFDCQRNGNICQYRHVYRAREIRHHFVHLVVQWCPRSHGLIFLWRHHWLCSSQ